MKQCKRCQFHKKGECTTGLISNIESLRYCSMFQPKPKRKVNENTK